jgi:hypothetical protein
VPIQLRSVRRRGGERAGGSAEVGGRRGVGRLGGDTSIRCARVGGASCAADTAWSAGFFRLIAYVPAPLVPRVPFELRHVQGDGVERHGPLAALLAQLVREPPPALRELHIETPSCTAALSSRLKAI